MKRKILIIGAGRGTGDILKKWLLFTTLGDISRNYFGDTAYISVRIGIDSFCYKNQFIPIEQPYYLSHAKHGFNEFVDFKDGDYDLTGKMIIPQATNLYVTKGNLSVTKCLKLILYGLLEPDVVSNNQHFVIGKTSLSASESNDYYNILSGRLFNGYEFIETIDGREVERILEGNYDRYSNLLNRKFYRRWIDKSTIGKIDYYLQNDSFYVYEIVDKPHEWADYYKVSLQEVMADTLGEKLFTLPNIYKIGTDSINNYFLFVNDTSFYHFDLALKTLNGPFSFPSLSWIEYFYFSGPVIYKGDGFTFPVETYLGKLNIVFDHNKGRSLVDTNSFEEGVKRYINGVKEEEDKAKIEAVSSTGISKPKYSLSTWTSLGVVLIILMSATGFALFLRRRRS